jgi:hypothetical protein
MKMLIPSGQSTACEATKRNQDQAKRGLGGAASGLTPMSCSRRPMESPRFSLYTAMDFIARPTMAAKTIWNMLGPSRHQLVKGSPNKNALMSMLTSEFQVFVPLP